MAVLRILVTKDLDQDVKGLKAAFSNAGVKTPLSFVRNGKEALDYLKGEGAFANRRQYPLPNLLLLDLTIRAVDGFGLLEWLRQRPELPRPLVVVFSSSEHPKEIKRAYDLGANSYLLKPSGFEKLAEAVREAENHWLRFNLVPLPAGLKNPYTTVAAPAAPSPDSKVFFTLEGT